MKRWWKKRRAGQVESLPDWASCFADTSELSRFESAVRDHFALTDTDALVHDGWIILAGAEGRRYGLQNLAQKCKQQPPRDWPAVIAEHFEAMFDGEARASEGEALLEAFETARDHLVVRLWETADLPGVMTEGVAEERIPGISCVLMLDQDRAAMSVPADAAAAWGVETSALIDLAIENVMRLEGDTRPDSMAQGGNATRLMLYEGETMYGAAVALRLDGVEGMVGRHGALVSIPTRSTVFCVPIDDEGFVEDIGPILKMTMYAENAGPGAVSAGLWWYREGMWTELPYAVEDGTLQFTPPEEFNAMVAGLVEGG